MRWIEVAFLATLLVSPAASAQAAGSAIARNEEARMVPAAMRGPLDAVARLRVENVSLPDGLTRLQEQSGVSLAFSPSLLSETRRVT